MFKSIIFDFDGTIADTNRGIINTFTRSFEELRLAVPSVADMSATIGLPLRQAFGVLHPELDDAMLDTCVETYRRFFYEFELLAISLFPGVKETLAALHGRGARMAIATSRGRNSLDIIMNNVGIAQYFEGVFTVESVVNHKPAPDLALLIIGELKYLPEETLVVGDTTFDLMMGQGAGCRVCGVTYGNHPAEKLMEVSPDYIIDSFHELTGII